MPKNNTILEVTNLNAAYGQSKVIFDINLNVKLNERVAIVGRNGAGKTTMLKCIAGLLKASSGSVIYDGMEIMGKAPFEVAKMGLKYIDQDKEVFLDLTVRENLQLSSYATGDYNWDRVFEHFPKLKILLDRKGAYLSGGERQMLMIGRAILGDPKVLLIDEPTEGLAPSIVNDLVTTFHDLSKDSAIIIVGQNLSFVSRVAQRIYAVKEGRMIAEIRDKEEIKEATYSRYL
ncbi:MAG TPA: ABC transporter ATP-binding protein [Firmicutes bacterium]|jgi:ABC-type branched-subunit amino acid transport system ATPase component|nr:ABC transporter ATP-binding protein [Bacillota bacterium]HBK67192.1 ABC transporter ATP-binding protein [Bacillota bacterium]HBT17062.1 ABC transporter ATP-binding protein [Bacillota bacterium]